MDGVQEDALSQPFILLELIKMYLFRRVSTLKVRGRKKSSFLSINLKGSNLLYCSELWLINLSKSKRKSRGLLSTLVPQHSHLLNSYLPSVRSWHRPNSVSAREASTSSSATLQWHSLQGKRMGTRLVDCQGHYVPTTPHSPYFHNTLY